MLRAVPASEPEVAFDVVDVLDGFAKLERRSPTLGGSVPLRVAQACVPLLEGNAWGLQITLARRIELRRRFGGWSVDVPDELERMARAAVAKAAADGILSPGAWRERLERGLVVASPRKISLFTGLYARPRPGVRLRQSATANRRSFAFTVDEAMIDSGFQPIVLDIVPCSDTIVLEGEVATLAPLPAQVALARCSLAEAADVAAAHVRFYDGEYFATKQRGQIARKYRDEIARRPDPPAGDVRMTIVEAGPRCVELRGDRAVFTNPVALSATFDGMHVIVEPDKAQLARYAAEVREAWQGVTLHEGALLYLTKYTTPHPAGEPHFFTKPCALVATPPGISTVIDGICGAGYDVLRGVIRSDAFHAAPAVFQLWQPGRTVHVPRGAPLAQLFATPAHLAEATFSAVSAWSW